MRGRAVVGHVRADALVAQAVGDVVGQLGLILHHQHPHGAIVHQRGSHGITSAARSGPVPRRLTGAASSGAAARGARPAL